MHLDLVYLHSNFKQCPQQLTSAGLNEVSTKTADRDAAVLSKNCVLLTLTQTLIELLVVQKTGFTQGPFILFQRSNLNSPLKTSFHFSLISGFLKCFPHFCLSHLFFNLLIPFSPFLVISFSQFAVTQTISSTVMTYLHYQLVNKSQLERGHPKKVSFVILRVSYSVFSSTELILSKKKKEKSEIKVVLLCLFFIIFLDFNSVTSCDWQFKVILLILYWA